MSYKQKPAETLLEFVETLAIAIHALEKPDTGGDRPEDHFARGLGDFLKTPEWETLGVMALLQGFTANLLQAASAEKNSGNHTDHYRRGMLAMAKEIAWCSSPDFPKDF